MQRFIKILRAFQRKDITKSLALKCIVLTNDLENKHVEQLDLFIKNSEQLVSVKEKRQQQETEAIRSRFEEYRQWIKETMNTEDQPYIQIVAAMIH